VTDRPICDRCSKPVTYFHVDVDKLSSTTVYVAECHGERECAEIDDVTIMAAGTWPPRVARAFVQKKELP
jgi:hypothetical protein